VVYLFTQIVCGNSMFCSEDERETEHDTAQVFLSSSGRNLGQISGSVW